MKLRKRHLLPTALAVVACGGSSANDAGFDAGRDSGTDSGIDSGVDAGADGGRDSGTPDSGTDAGTADSGNDSGTPDSGMPCPHPDTGNDMTVRCTCEVAYEPDGGFGYQECCDEDIGNPCPVCCLNPRGADGGRVYYPDSGTAVCYC